MDKQTAIRRVRIAVSVFFGLLTLAMLALWARSYHHLDVWEFRKNTSRPIVFGSMYGHVTLSFKSIPNKPVSIWRRFYETEPLGMGNWEAQRPPRTFQFLAYRVVVPHWFGAVIFAGLSAVPWVLLSKQYSLRTMLIATTLIAGTLGLAVWLVR